MATKCSASTDGKAGAGVEVEAWGAGSPPLHCSIAAFSCTLGAEGSVLVGVLWGSFPQVRRCHGAIARLRISAPPDQTIATPRLDTAQRPPHKCSRMKHARWTTTNPANRRRTAAPRPLPHAPRRPHPARCRDCHSRNRRSRRTDTARAKDGFLSSRARAQARRLTQSSVVTTAEHRLPLVSGVSLCCAARD
jgi:hypothetical protein